MSRLLVGCVGLLCVNLVESSYDQDDLGKCCQDITPGSRSKEWTACDMSNMHLKRITKSCSPHGSTTYCRSGRYALCGGKKEGEVCFDMPDSTGGKCVMETNPFDSTCQRRLICQGSTKRGVHFK